MRLARAPGGGRAAPRPAVRGPLARHQRARPPAVEPDDFGGARAAARHHFVLGRRRVAVPGIGLSEEARRALPDEVRATRFVNVRERALGFWAGLAEAGLAEADLPVLAIRNDGSNLDAALALVFGCESPAPGALLAMSDLLALRAMGWLAARGL